MVFEIVFIGALQLKFRQVKHLLIPLKMSHHIRLGTRPALPVPLHLLVLFSVFQYEDKSAFVGRDDHFSLFCDDKIGSPFIITVIIVEDHIFNVRTVLVFLSDTDPVSVKIRIENPFLDIQGWFFLDISYSLLRDFTLATGMIYSEEI